jgi:hypothetical protein
MGDLDSRIQEGPTGTMRDGRGRLQHGSGPQGRGFDSLQAHIFELRFPIVVDRLPDNGDIIGHNVAEIVTRQGCCVITILNGNWGAVTSASIPPLAMRSSFVLSRGIAGVPDTPSYLRLDVRSGVACNETRRRSRVLVVTEVTTGTG